MSQMTNQIIQLQSIESIKMELKAMTKEKVFAGTKSKINLWTPCPLEMLKIIVRVFNLRCKKNRSTVVKLCKLRLENNLVNRAISGGNPPRYSLPATICSSIRKAKRYWRRSRWSRRRWSSTPQRSFWKIRNLRLLILDHHQIFI